MAPGRATDKPFSDGELRGLLAAIAYDLSAWRARHWTPLQKYLAWKWAVRHHLAQRYPDIRVPKMPPHVAALPHINSEAS